MKLAMGLFVMAQFALAQGPSPSARPCDPAPVARIQRLLLPAAGHIEAEVACQRRTTDFVNAVDEAAQFVRRTV